MQTPIAFDYTSTFRGRNPILIDNTKSFEIQVVDWYCGDSKEIKYYKLGKHLYKKDYYYRPDSESEDEGSDSEEDSEEQEFGSEFLVYMYGLTSDGDSVCAKITGFKPFFYIKVPDYWKPFHLEVLMNKLREKIWPKRYKKSLVSYEMIKAKSFYYFTAEDKFNFARLTFEDYNSFKTWSFMFKKDITVHGLNANKPHRYDLYESNINPMIRLTHLKEILPSGWVQFQAKSYKVIHHKYGAESTCQLELEIHYKDLKPIKDKTDIAPMIMAAFDIEANSSHGDFPVPKKDYQKLARDLVIEYVNVMKAGEDLKMMNEPRKVLETWLRLSFEDYYQNYNINRIVIDEDECKEQKIETILDRVLEICKSYSSIVRWELENFKDDKKNRHSSIEKDSIAPYLREKQELTRELHVLFEMSLPPVDYEAELTSHYGLLAQQVLNEYASLDNKNTKILHENPREWLKYVINLSFDPYFNSHNINRVYTKNNKKPNKETIKNIVPQVYSICSEYYELLEWKEKTKRLGSKWAEKNTTDTKVSEDGSIKTQDNFVNELVEILNKYLPEVEGDVVIQIGTTFQRYGEKHPYLKHIICLDTCEEIDNKTLIRDENKDITFPDGELTNGLKKIYQDIQNKTLEGFEVTETYWEILDQMFNKEVDVPLELNSLNKEIKHGLNSLLLDYNFYIQLQEDTSTVIVESYKTEEEVLMAWTRLIQQTDPDLITGYNVFGFDYKFLYERSDQLGCMKEFTKLGRFKEISQGLTEQELSSSGLGENILTYIPMFGRVILDLYKVIQAGHKLPMYGLNYVSKHFMHKKKNDISPNDIFIKQKGSAADRRLIAEYCLIDCVLCNRLLNKLDIVTNNVGMSNVCLVPLSYLFLRGQGVKILSLVAEKCRHEGYLIPVLDKNCFEDDGYEGAIVLHPKSNIFFEPIVVCDFNSLYPSCMISENLSHDAYVIPGSKYDNLPEYDYVDIEYDLYREEPVPGRKVTKKIKCGVKVCRFAQMKDGSKSLLPRILMSLLKARKDTRKDQKAFPKGSFNWKVKEGLQLAYKVTANSLYGQVGARTSSIYLKDIAACTTATGRKLIYFTKNFFESNYKNCEAVYGDSVTGDTTVIFRYSLIGAVFIDTVEGFWDLLEKNKNNKAQPYKKFKPWDDDGHESKEQIYEPCGGVLETWTKSGWAKVKRVIRHKTNKKIYRITTRNGSQVEVTEDHSLLSPDGKEVKPDKIAVGDKLLQKFPPKDDLQNDLANKIKKFGNINTEGVEKSHITLAFKEEAQRAFCYYKSLGYNPIICEKDEPSNGRNVVYTVFKNEDNVFTENPNIIISIDLLRENTGEYVYDLETEDGSFQAGLGDIIVKNTDSVFLKFDCRDALGEKLYGLDAIYKSIELCIEGSLAISRQLKKPHNLEFEKGIFPFILITKKRYHGHYYTEYGVNSYYANSMGIVLKRRDNAPIVKHVFGSVIDIIMIEHNIEKAMKHAQMMARELLDGKYPLDMFVITKSLKSYYKNPMQIAHNVLAQRIGKRDPGNKPQANDRIPYAYIKVPEGQEKGILQGDKIETPQFITDNELKIDYKFYLTNQIMKPVAQIFELVVDDVSKLFADAIRDYDYKLQGVRKITDWFKVKKVEKTELETRVDELLIKHNSSDDEEDIDMEEDDMEEDIEGED